MTAPAVLLGQLACRPHLPISEAQPGCQRQPDRAEHREPRSGALDSPAKRSYPYTTTPPARPAQCGLIDLAICGVKTAHPCHDPADRVPVPGWLKVPDASRRNITRNG